MHKPGVNAEQQEKDANFKLTLAIWTGDVNTTNYLLSAARLRTDWRFPMDRSALRPKLDGIVPIDDMEVRLDAAVKLLGDSPARIRVGPFEAALLTGNERAASVMFTSAHTLERSGSRTPDTPSCLVAFACIASPATIWSLTDFTDQVEWEQPGAIDRRSALDFLVDRGGKAIIGFLRSIAVSGDARWIRALTHRVPRAAWEERWGEWGSGADALHERGGEALSAYQNAWLDENTSTASRHKRHPRL